VLRRVLVALACALAFVASPVAAADGEAKGSLSYKGQTLALRHVYFVKGPDEVDATKIIRRIIFTGADIGAKLRACRAMRCVFGEILEGMEIDLDAGPRLNYWVALNDQRLQYSGTARPAVLKIAGQDPKRLAGTLAIDDTAAGGAKVDAEFAATLLKEFPAAR
jgi:hypothetical protein